MDTSFLFASVLPVPKPYLPDCVIQAAVHGTVSVHLLNLSKQLSKIVYTLVFDFDQLQVFHFNFLKMCLCVIL
jgi:hypothetical protein